MPGQKWTLRNRSNYHQAFQAISVNQMKRYKMKWSSWKELVFLGLIGGIISCFARACITRSGFTLSLYFYFLFAVFVLKYRTYKMEFHILCEKNRYIFLYFTHQTLDQHEILTKILISLLYEASGAFIWGDPNSSGGILIGSNCSYVGTVSARWFSTPDKAFSVSMN